MTTERVPSMAAPVNGMRPIHPGEVLREEFLLPLGLKAHALAMALQVPAPRINDIVRERRTVTVDTAMRLARYFGMSAQFWLGLQTAAGRHARQTRTGGVSAATRRRRMAHKPLSATRRSTAR